MARPKKTVVKRRAPAKRKPKPVPHDKNDKEEPAINNHKQVVRVSLRISPFGTVFHSFPCLVQYKAIGRNGRPIYITETYRKEYKQNVLYVQDKESFERIRLQTIPVDLKKCLPPKEK